MNRNFADDLLDSLLDATGGKAVITRAIEIGDEAKIVRMAMGALNRTKSLKQPAHSRDTKSASKSNEHRKLGNKFYVNGEFKKTIECYFKALAYAPIGSLEHKLAYANISAVMLKIKAYQACRLNIQEAIALDCPAFLREKLNKRMKETNKHINEEIRFDIQGDADIQNFLEFNVQKNSEISCATRDVCVTDKRIVAADNIKSGTTVALEKAFVSVQAAKLEYTSCYYCHRLGFFLIPCEGCCKALFCTKECEQRCFEEYHRIECEIVSCMGSTYQRDISKLAVRAAIKMSLQMSWDQLGVASLEMGKKRLQNSPVKDAYDPASPVSLLCYDDAVTVDKKTMFDDSLICAYAVYNLGEVPDYLPEDKNGRDKAMDALSRIILHLRTTFRRKITVHSAAYDYCSESIDCEAQGTQGWFSFASKLEHSCDPNLMVVGINDRIGLVAIKRIRKGDPLTISYVCHFYDVDAACGLMGINQPSKFRKELISKNLGINCQCPACVNNWHCMNQTVAKLTPSQEEAFAKYEKAAKILDPRVKNVILTEAISKALDELTDCVNSVQHWRVYRDFSRMIKVQCAMFVNKCYKKVF